MPEPQHKDPDADEYAFLNNEFKDVKFNVLNIKHFFKNNKGFLDYAEKFNPTAIVIDWCHSKDGDVANLLVTSGILPRIWLTAGKNMMLGPNDQWIELGN